MPGYVYANKFIRTPKFAFPCSLRAVATSFGQQRTILNAINVLVRKSLPVTRSI